MALSERFIPYLLEMPMSDQEEDGTSLAVVLVLVVKPSGVLLAAPVDFFSEDILDAGHQAGPDDMIGPSCHVVAPAGRLQQMDGSPPIAEEPGRTLELVLVDSLPDIAEHMILVSDYSGPTDALHLFDPDPFVYPMKDEVLASAWDWIVQPTSGDRINYYSAHEEEDAEELVPAAVEEPQQPAANHTQPGQGQPRQGTGIGRSPKGIASPKTKRPTVAQLASSLEGLTAALPTLTTQIAELNKRTIAMEDQMRNPSRLSALSQPLGSSATPGFVATSGTSPVELLKEMPPPVRTLALKTYAKPSGFRKRDGGVRADGGEGFERRSERYGEGNVCSINCDNCLGCPDSKYERRLNDRSFVWSLWDVQQGCFWPDETPAGAGFQQRSLLRCGDGEHVPEDEPGSQFKYDTYADECPRSNNDSLCGEIWWFRPSPGLWSNHVAGGNDHEPLTSGKLARCEGHGSTSVGLPGAVGSGWDNGCGSAVVFGGGPTLRSVHEPIIGTTVSRKGICSTGGCQVDNGGIVVHQGAGHHRPATVRCGGRSAGIGTGDTSLPPRQR